MPSYKFAFTSNAGLAINFPSSIIWVDAIHDIKAPTYSTVTPDIREQVFGDPDYIGEYQQGPDALVFSHCHIDHFTSDIVRYAKSRFPRTKVYLPEKYFPDEIYVHGDTMDVNVKDVSLKFIKTFHCTKRHHNKTHYSLLMNDGNINIFMPMDSSTTDPAMHYYAVDTDIDVAIVDFVWTLLQKGRDVILNDIKPKHLLLYHLPFERDDLHNWREQTREAIKLMDAIPDIRILDTPCQKEIIDI